MTSTADAPAEEPAIVRREPRFCECCPPPRPNAPTTTTGKLKAHILHEDWFTWTNIEKLECAAAPRVFAFMSAPADRKANTFCAHRLDYNKLGPEGGAALAEGLKGNSNLQSLS